MLRIAVSLTAIAIALTAATSARVPSEPIFDSLTLERTVCYGACPAYRLRILSTGYVQYEGLDFVHVTGRRTKQLNAEQIKELDAEVRRINLFKLRDSYTSAADGCPSVWTDNPSAIITVQVGYQIKVVNHYYGCRERTPGGYGTTYPPGLEQFSSRIDEIVGTRDWVLKPPVK